MYDMTTRQTQANSVIDLRSDTVTRPCAGMRAAMFEAPLGDDVYGEDPTVNALEEKAASLLGKEAGLFVSSGTQSNLCAVAAHCARGEEALVGDCYHIAIDEAHGVSVLASVAMSILPTGPNGQVTPEDVVAHIKPDDFHCPISKLLCLENTVWGQVLSLEEIAAPAKAGRDAGLKVHLDGARFFNAITALDCQPQDLARHADSVSICLSKGLGTPVGTVLVGDSDVIHRARRFRKMLGGGTRQAGILAAAGLFALEHNVQRLAEDHQRARQLADALSAIEGLNVDDRMTQSNMVFVNPDTSVRTKLPDIMEQKGIVLSYSSGRMRLVMHKDVDDSGLERVVDAFRSAAA